MLKPLAELRRADASTCGAKAACLGELAALGHHVPAGVVLPVSAYHGFIRGGGLDAVARARARESVTAPVARLVEIAGEIARAFEAAGLPPDIEATLAGYASGAAAVAVRSSATNEDLPGASFAGQYVSSLNVPASGIGAAVLRCYASLFGARAALYRRRKAIADVGAMAVIVQHMVHPDHAGVVFTRAPRRPDAVLVECTLGCGDAVVSGTAAPNRYYLDRSTLDVEEACERRPLDRAAVRRVAREALAVEASMGGAQDVEYAAAGGIVHVLQARPAGAAAPRLAGRGEA